MLIGTLLSYSESFVTIKTTYGVLKINEDDIKYIVIPATEELKGSYDKPCIVLKTGDIITGKVSSYTPPIGKVKVSSALGELTIEKLSDILYIIFEPQVASVSSPPELKKGEISLKKKVEYQFKDLLKFTAVSYERLENGGLRIYILVENISEEPLPVCIKAGDFYAQIVDDMGRSDYGSGESNEIDIVPKMPLKIGLTFDKKELAEAKAIVLNLPFSIRFEGCYSVSLDL